MNKPNIICDLDGTLADLTHRLHYIKGAKKYWGVFHAQCVDDKPYEDVIEIVDTFRLGNCGCAYPSKNLYILSGRNEVVRDETERWLEDNTPFTLNTTLVMRKVNDFRPDTEVKRDMVRELGLTPDNTLCVFDDRQCVVDMWREMGFRCLQVQAWSEL